MRHALLDWLGLIVNPKPPPPPKKKKLKKLKKLPQSSEPIGCGIPVDNLHSRDSQPQRQCGRHADQHSPGLYAHVPCLQRWFGEVRRRQQLQAIGKPSVWVGVAANSVWTGSFNFWFSDVRSPTVETEKPGAKSNVLWKNPYPGFFQNPKDAPKTVRFFAKTRFDWPDKPKTASPNGIRCIHL